ncbi:tyrosine-type recombinase/integrase [Photobacterium sp. MCCC 1A19761]|uniref:tyrosine-type recombinase/integrase n=1 Tax=Photobacterium sp. MCCC 1A19761 TaxID=3115000 RepID=UPI00307D5002
MYRYVIGREISQLRYQNSRTPKRMPTVLSEREVKAILCHLRGKYWLLAAILYGCGLRIQEALSLRIKDINFDSKSIFVFNGKSSKDRYTLLPNSLISPLTEQVEIARQVHRKDLDDGAGMASVPPALLRKYKGALKLYGWQFIFPSSHGFVNDMDTSTHHLH